MPPDEITTAESDLRVLAVRIEHLHDSMDAMKEAMCSMAEAVNKLAVVEDRQSQSEERQAKLDSRLDRIEDRLRAVEIAEPMQSAVTDWIMRAVFAAAAAAVAFIAAKSGLL